MCPVRASAAGHDCPCRIGVALFEQIWDCCAVRDWEMESLDPGPVHIWVGLTKCGSGVDSHCVSIVVEIHGVARRLGPENPHCPLVKNPFLCCEAEHNKPQEPNIPAEYTC